jgi:hypothetical protein
MADRSKRTGNFSPLAIYRVFNLATAALIIGCGLTEAQENAPCMQIRTACIQAGFKAGAAKDGFGLMSDCVHPVMQGLPPRAKAAKPLPQIDAQLIAACKANNPDFGQRKRAPSPPSGGNEPSTPRAD